MPKFNSGDRVRVKGTDLKGTVSPYQSDSNKQIYDRDCRLIG